MAILWCGGEELDFPTFTGCTISTLSNYRRASYSRCSITAGTSAQAKSTAFPGGSVTSCWFSYQVHVNFTAGARCIGLGLHSTARSGLYIGASASSASKVALFKYDGTTQTELAAESGNSFPSSNLVKVDAHIQNYGESATLDVYVNGSLVLSFTGDVSVSGVTGLDCVMIGPPSGLSGSYFSEIIVADQDTRNMSLLSCVPNAAGDASDWTGAYTAIDEAILDDADVVYDNTDGHQALFNLSAMPAGSFSILGMKLAVRATRSSDSTPESLDIGIKSGGSVDVADNHSLSTGWATCERYMAVNPVTGNPFTPAEIDALQLVLESEA